MRRSRGMSDDGAQELDAIVVGAGFAGLYALYRFRKRGICTRVLEAGPAIGGTWYWNCYPGARCDVDSLSYSYGFSDELDQDWVWTEKYASQPEILSYIDHVADRFDLRRDIQLDTRIRSASYDQDAGRWTLIAESGERFSARFCVMATGGLSAPLDPPYPGLDRFEGESYTTSRYPTEGVDYAGKRVAFVGTGSTGIQAIPLIAEQAAQLTVFQRTPNFAIPGRNRPLEPSEVAAMKARYTEHRQEQRWSAFGFGADMVPSEISALEVSPDERRAELERRWELGGAANFMQAFSDVMLAEEANAAVADFVRDKIRERVRDSEAAELLCPTDHPLASKRLCVDHGYYETYNRDNVTLVDLRRSPIVEITPAGIRTEDRDHEFDVIVFALGYDAGSGPLLAIDIRGRGGVTLREAWRDGPRTYLGLMVDGFPNLFIVTGPGSPSLMAVVVVAIEQHVDWIARCIDDLRERGLETIEATRAAADAWTRHVADVGNMTLFPKADSFYMGANVPGKPRVLTIYLGGFGNYRTKCDEVAAAGYEGFALGAAA